MKQEEEINNISDTFNNKNRLIFTDFKGNIKSRLSAVIPIRVTNTTENTPISARYECRVKVVCHRDLMGLIEGGDEMATEEVDVIDSRKA
jgi:hypothetical protein